MKRDQVRLLKQFLKGINCYGAEAKVEGFSGYLAELLILKYGSFRQVLKNSLKWTEKTLLSLTEIPHIETASFGSENFVFIDPVDKSRNVAAALSLAKLKFFVLAAEAYLKHPKKEFFFPRDICPLSTAEMNRMVKNFVGIRFSKPELVDDILYPQIRKALASIDSLLLENDFIPNDHGYHVNDDVLIVFKLQNMNIPEKKLHMGPPTDKTDHVEAFLEKWNQRQEVLKEPYMKDGRWWVQIRRDYTFALSLLKQKKDRINLGKNLNILKKDMDIYTDEQLRHKSYARFWAEHFLKKLPWER
jgi:tRNA nucleotidyltransferase (CCA-adding enzyme)